MLTAARSGSGGHCRFCLVKINALRDARRRGDDRAQELHAADLAQHRATAHRVVRW
ncbi:hypothetical protein GCM10020221_14850 [Streptomyces thioluteus]|uniref:Uncharacterized protein n=1 Tax=Streptomyces thioluteus TaxID=66431 RepID=A0ABN3WMY2_STRTU